jgi:predicted ATPase
VLDGIAALVDQSLVRQLEQAGGGPRFGMLETIREFALEQLEASGEADLVRHHHATYFLTLAEATEPKMLSAQREEGLVQQNAELDNVRAALGWSLRDKGDYALGLRLVGALAWFAHFGNHVSELYGWLLYGARA